MIDGVKARGAACVVREGGSVEGRGKERAGVEAV